MKEVVYLNPTVNERVVFYALKFLILLYIILSYMYIVVGGNF